MPRTFLLIPLVLAALFAASPGAKAQSATRSLSIVLPDVDFAGVPLGDAIEFLGDVSGANLHVNWRDLEAAGVGRDTMINLRLRNVSLGRVLELVLREAGGGEVLAFYADHGIIEITTRERANAQLFTRVYAIEDLILDVPDFIGPDFNISGSANVISDVGTGREVEAITRSERIEQLIEIIQSIIEPDVWDVNGGSAAIRYLNGSLIVSAPRSVHEALGGGYVN